MLSAELHGKISGGNPPNERMEDVLTSYVLCLFRYLDDLRIPSSFLGRAVNLREEPLSIGELQGAQIAFWPRFTLPGNSRRREADALLILNGKDGSSAVVVVEAKYRSGPSNLLTDTEDGKEVQDDDAQEWYVEYGKQLADEYCSTRCGSYDLEEVSQKAMTQASHRVVYVTANYVQPAADLWDAVEAIRNRKCPHKNHTCSSAPEQDIYWVNWQALYEILEDEARRDYAGYSKGDCNLLDDLKAALEVRGLLPFRPFECLKQVEQYEQFCIGDRVSPRPLWERLEYPGVYVSLFSHK